MIDCFVIDDEYPAIEVLENYINQSTTLRLLGSTTNPIEGLDKIRNLKPQVVFLDIEMQDLCGLDLKELIDKNIVTIFCTAYSEYAIKSFELQVADYLVKPISHNRFLKTVLRLEEIFHTRLSAPYFKSSENFITLKAEHKGKLVKIDFDEIDFVESRRNYVAFHKGKTKILSYNTMKEVEDRLPRELFIRIHKSFIVSLKQVQGIEYNEIILKHSSQRLPVGNNYKSNILEKLNQQLL